jgi:DNA repair protein RadC
MSTKNINAGHRARLRERYLRGGLEIFADHEVLELLLFYCYPQRDTKPIAKKMLAEFGTLANLFEADAKTITERLGCSENIAVLISLIPALTGRYFHSKWGKAEIIDSPRKAGDYALSLCAGHTAEHFYVISVDARNRLADTALISRGTTGEAAVYPAEVAKAALQARASAVILVHNHPGGTIKPSRGDLEITRALVQLLKYMNIPVLDHIIVAGDTYYSFAARNQFVEGF